MLSRKFISAISKQVMSREFRSSAALNRIIRTKSDEDFFTRVMDSYSLVLVNFHSEKNEHSKKLTPILDELLAAHTSVDLATVDYDDAPSLVKTLKVSSVPTVLAVQNGLVVDKLTGEIDKKMVVDFINKLGKKV